MMIKHIISLVWRITLALSLPTLSGLVVAASGDDAVFLRTRDAAKLGDVTKVTKLVSQLKNDDLLPWAEYYLIKFKLEDSNAADSIRAFLAHYEGSYLADRLRSEWLPVLGRAGRWVEFGREYERMQRQPARATLCYHWQDQARLHDTSYQMDFFKAWNGDAELPVDACSPVVDRIYAAGELGAEEIWGRLRNNLVQGRLRELGRWELLLPVDQQFDTSILDRLMSQPEPYLAANDTTAFPTGIVGLAVVAQAKLDPVKAMNYMYGLEGRFSTKDRADIWGYIGLRLALNLSPEALQVYDKTAAMALYGDKALWRLRSALRAMDWSKLHDYLEHLDSDTKAQPEWTYWLARCHAVLGRQVTADELYGKIKGIDGFYGKLAAEELGVKISIPQAAQEVTQAEVDAVAVKSSFRRALRLFQLGMRTEGVAEWNWALRSLKDRQLIAAAMLAKQSSIIDRAIAAADRTEGEHDYSLRYPSPYHELVTLNAYQTDLDEAFVYGLIRQESRFVTSAKSSVGAQGLMQVMPATAAWVAKKFRMKGYSASQAAETSINVALGTRYLRTVLDNLGNQPILATAAYNAGPTRAKRWAPIKPMEGAIFIETIPIGETRDYVKKVMLNTSYYAALFNNVPQSLKARLGTVKPLTEAILNLEVPE